MKYMLSKKYAGYDGSFMNKFSGTVYLVPVGLG